MGTTEYSITDDFTNLGVGERPQAAQLHNEILASSAFSDPVNDFMGVNVAVNDQGEIDADAVTVHWSVAPSNLAALNAVIAAHPDTGVTPEPAAGDFVPGLQARRSTEFTATLNTFVDIPFDLTDFENDPESLEHDNTNTERLLIKETGDYEVGYFGDVDAGQDSVLQMRIRKNGTETLNGTLAEVAEGEGDSDTCTYTTGRKTLVSLDAGDYLTVQVCRESGGNCDIHHLSAFVKSMQGEKGDQGPTGAGSSVIVKDETLAVSGGPFSEIDFHGSDISVADGGGGRAVVTIASSAPVYGSQSQDIENLVAASTSANWRTTPFLTLTTGNLPAGRYRICWHYIWRHTSTSRDFRAKVLHNSTDYTNDDGIVGGANGHMQEPKDAGSDQRFHTQAFKYMNLSGVNTFRLYFGRNSGGTAHMIEGRMEIWRVS